MTLPVPHGSVLGMSDDDKPDSFGAAEPEPTVAEKGEAALDDAIDKMLGPDEDEAPRESKGAKGVKALAGDEPEEDDEPEVDEEDESEADDDELEASAEDDDEPDEESDEDEDDEDMALHRAYTKLHDALNVPASVLKSMPKAKLIAWAERVGEEEAEAPSKDSKETEQGRETREAAKQSGEAKPTGTSWPDFRRSLAEKLGIDEDSADAMKPLYDRLEAIEAKQTTAEAQRAEDRAAAARRDGQATIDTELRRLGRMYPKLSRDSEKQDAIVEEASTTVAGLKAQKKPIDVRAVFNKAARAVMGDPKRSDLAAKRRNGVSTPPETLGLGRTTPLDEAAYWDRGVSLAIAGKGKDAIARLKPPPMKPGRS